MSLKSLKVNLKMQNQKSDLIELDPGEASRRQSQDIEIGPSPKIRQHKVSSLRQSPKNIGTF